MIIYHRDYVINKTRADDGDNEEEKKLKYLLQPTATRQAMFRQTKHFKCACKRCIEI